MARKTAQAEPTLPIDDAGRAAAPAASPVASGGEAWIETQSELLDRIDAMAKGWVQRRREALDAARQSLGELNEFRDPSDLLRIQQEWLSGSLQRVASDLESLTRIALDFSQRPMRLLVASSRWPGAAEAKPGNP
jgi:Phasin protein